MIVSKMADRYFACSSGTIRYGLTAVVSIFLSSRHLGEKLFCKKNWELNMIVYPVVSRDQFVLVVMTRGGVMRSIFFFALNLKMPLTASACPRVIKLMRK